MSSMNSGNFNLIQNVIRIFLILAILSLWVACFVINKKTIESLNSDHSELKKQITQLRYVVWSLYATYLIYYFLQIYNPVSGMISGSTQIGTIGVILTTILILCITHVTDICTSDSCDSKTASEHLNKINILLSILVAVHVGTFLVTFSTIYFKPEEQGLTAEILKMLRTPSRKINKTPSRRTFMGIPME